MNRQQRKKVTLTAVFVIVVIALFSANQASLDFVPGFEGEQGGFYGYQVAGTSTQTLGNSLPAGGACSYTWGGSPTPTAISVTVKSYSGPGGCNFLTENFGSDTLTGNWQSNLIPYSSQFTQPIKVSYTVKSTGTQVVGSVEEYTSTIDIGIASGSAGDWNFPQDTIWSSVVSSQWNNAYSGQTDVGTSASYSSSAVFEAPLYGVVTNVVLTGGAQSNDCSLCTVGSELSLYSFASGQSPTTTGQTLVTLAQPSSVSGLNSSLASSGVLPDTRMSQVVYFPITIDNMKANCNLGNALFGCTDQNAAITIQWYTLRIGQYILTNPSTTGLSGYGNVCSGIQCDFNAIGGFFANPFNLLGLGIYGIILVAVAAFVVIFALTGSVPFLRRRKTGE